VSTAAHHVTGCAAVQLLCIGAEEVRESIKGDVFKHMYEAASGMV
jgi:hypothetical protein